MTTNDDDYSNDEYMAGYEQGFTDCNKRYMDILAKFPLQCAMISARLPLNAGIPDEILEKEKPL